MTVGDLEKILAGIKNKRAKIRVQEPKQWGCAVDTTNEYDLVMEKAENQMLEYITLFIDLCGT